MMNWKKSNFLINSDSCKKKSYGIRGINILQVITNFIVLPNSQTIKFTHNSHILIVDLLHQTMTKISRTPCYKMLAYYEVFFLLVPLIFQFIVKNSKYIKVSIMKTPRAALV